MAAPRYQNARWFIAGVSASAVIAGAAYFLDTTPQVTASEPATEVTVAPTPTTATANPGRITNTTTTRKKSRGS